MARRILGFNENDHQRVSRAVKRVEAMRDARNRRQRRFSSTDKLKFYNNSGETIPQYAIMKISGAGRFAGVDCIQVEKPNTFDLHDCVINLSGDVPYQSIGNCTYGPAIVKYTGTDPVVGQAVSTRANVWTVAAPGAGYRVLGILSTADKLVYIQPQGEPGVMIEGNNSTQTVSTSSQTKLEWNPTASGTYQFGDNFSDANNRAIAQHNGAYSYHFSCDIVATYDSGADLTDSLTQVTILSKTNGVALPRDQATIGMNSSFARQARVCLSGVQFLLVNDYLEFYIEANGSGCYPLTVENYSFHMHRVNCYQPP